MYGFMMISECPAEEVPRVLKVASRVTRRLMPTLGRALQTNLVELPEVNGGWFTLAIEDDPWPALLDAYVDHAVAVLVYGTSPDGARVVGEAVLQNGPTVVYDLPGEFAAVVVDRRDRTITLTSTLLNRYGIRHTTAERGPFAVASFEVSLVASGLVPVEPDYPSLAGMLKVEYALNGHGFLHGVRHLRAHQPVHRGSDGRMSLPGGWRIDHEARIQPSDRGAAKQQNELAERILLSEVARQVQDTSSIVTDLTAGQDSRAVFGALLATNRPANIECKMAGEPNSPDVRTARRLAALNGARFAVQPGDAATDRFVENLDLLAFYMNGFTSGKRATVERSYPEAIVIHAHGGGGEIFTDFYGEKAFNPPGGSDRRALRDYLLQRPPGNFEPELQRRLAARVEETLDDLQSMSSDPWDLATHLYAFCRMSQWGALTAVVPWWRDRYLPFFNSSLFQTAMRLPPPLHRTFNLHRRLIMRHVRGGGRIPINQHERPVLAGDETWKRALRWLDSRSLLAWNRFRSRRVRLVSRARRVDQVRADLFTDRYAATIREILLSNDGCVPTLFGSDRATALLEGHQVGDMVHTSLVGTMLVMNRHLEMLYEGRRLAKAQHS